MFENEPELIVLDRIFEKHAICEEDVEEAMKSMIKFQRRDSGAYIAVGFDRNGRKLELIYDYDSSRNCFRQHGSILKGRNSFTVFHAMGATKKFLRELGLGD